jgi:3-oxoacyl-[acyl-carrier protein] reductase
MKKNIIISGASKNLGLFLGRFFFKKKCNIINISRNLKITKEFYNFNCDLAKEDEVLSTFKKIKKKFKKIDLLILCAGNSKKTFQSHESSQDFQKSFNDNFYSMVNLISSYTKIYKFRSTKIVGISSIAGLKITKAPITYSVAKSAINFYAKYKAKELAKFKISLNIISPGNILQPNNNWDKKIKENKSKTLIYISKNVPMNNFCKPLEIADTINLILNTKNNFITGSNFVIDGGETL